MKQAGFTLVEVVVAMGILSVAVLGLALCIPVAVQANQRNRVDAEAAMLAQRQLEQMIVQPLAATTFTDADGRANSIAAGGSPLTAAGNIDFTQPAVAGYSATLQGASGASFELRWNVQAVADGGKQFTLGARRRGSQRGLLLPVNLSVRQGK